VLQGKIKLTLLWYLGILMFCYPVKVCDNCLSSKILEPLENITTDFTLLAIVAGLGTSRSSFKKKLSNLSYCQLVNQLHRMT